MLLTIDLEALGLFVAAAGLFVGVLSWWLGKFLTDKKEITILQERVKYLEQRMDNVEGEIRHKRK